MLCEALESFAAQEQCRVLILRGAGPVFCSGLDLDEAARRRTGRAECAVRRPDLPDPFRFPLVTIAAVHGAAYAGGAGLMACCDFIVASDDLRICFPEVRRGLVPALAAVALVRFGTAISASCSCWPSRSMPGGRRDGTGRSRGPGRSTHAAGEALAATVLKGVPKRSDTNACSRRARLSRS